MGLSRGVPAAPAFTPTEDERVLKRLDDDGEVIGFLIHELSTLKQPSPVEFELAPEAPADDVARVTVSRAAAELGVSGGRVRQLAREGRVRGAVKAGHEWLIPMPVEVIPGARGPAGVAGRPDAAQSAAIAVEGRNADQGADRAAVQPAQLRQLGRQRQ